MNVETAFFWVDLIFLIVDVLFLVVEIIFIVVMFKEIRILKREQTQLKVLLPVTKRQKQIIIKKIEEDEQPRRRNRK